MSEMAHLNNIRTELVSLNANVKALVEETRTANLLALVAAGAFTVPQIQQAKQAIVARIGTPTS